MPYGHCHKCYSRCYYQLLEPQPEEPSNIERRSSKKRPEFRVARCIWTGELFEVLYDPWETKQNSSNKKKERHYTIVHKPQPVQEMPIRQKNVIKRQRHTIKNHKTRK
jgi:hypothetical protein